MCPAVGRAITPADCGEHRHSHYACPAECPHNPFARTRYSEVLELERTVDGKAMDWLKKSAPDFSALEQGVRRAMQDESAHALHAFFGWRIFFQRDADGLTCAQRWEAAGFPGLNNDAQVLMRAKMQMQPTLVEVQTVLDSERTDTVDLLAPGRPRRLFVDRALAASASRFTSFIGWVFPLPHFWRLAGTVIVVPDLGPFEPVEVVTELVRHLGGPTAPDTLPRWLAEHWTRLADALGATIQARHHDMLTATDAQFGKAVYELRAPFAECCRALEAVEEVDDDDLAPSERQEGFAEARVWFETSPEPVVALPPGGQVVLGRILLGQTFWRLEAIGRERLEQLRAHFEAALAHRVQFAGERRDDVGRSAADRNLQFDAALVPPRLREQPSRLVLASSRPRQPLSARSFEEYEAELFRAQDRAFPDQSVPALDGKTPRVAARDPALRPKLIRLMKSRVRALDESNLRTGRSDDLNWLLRELGLEEILLPPPPPRLPPEAEDDEAPEFDDLPRRGLRQAPPLLAGPMSFETASERLRAGLAAFDTAEAALRELDASGATLIADLQELTEGRLRPREFSLLLTFVIQAWLALVPPGSAAPPVDFDRLTDAFQAELTRLAQALETRADNSVDLLLAGCRQPALTELVMAGMLETGSHLPAKDRPRAATEGVMLALLKAVINEIDQALATR